MRKCLIGVVAIGLWWMSASTPYAHGQKVTEIFIPLGQSPGLSAKVTVIGKIETVSAGQRTITVAGPQGTWSAQISERTNIWLDRSRLKLVNQKGTFVDLRRGRLVELKYEDGERRDRGPAEWVKVQLAEPGSE